MQNWKCRQIAKSRQIAKPSTSQIRNPLRMIHMQYQKNPFKTLGRVAFWIKVYELNKQINK